MAVLLSSRLSDVGKRLNQQPNSGSGRTDAKIGAIQLSGRRLELPRASAGLPGQRDPVRFAGNTRHLLLCPLFGGLRNPLLARGNKVPPHEVTSVERLPADEDNACRRARTDAYCSGGIEYGHDARLACRPVDLVRAIDAIERELRRRTRGTAGCGKSDRSLATPAITLLRAAA